MLSKWTYHCTIYCWINRVLARQKATINTCFVTLLTLGRLFVELSRVMGYFWVSWLMKTIEHALSFATTNTWLSPFLILKDIPCKMCIWLCQMERCRLTFVVPALPLGIKSILLWRVEIIWKIAWFQIFCNGFTLIRVTDSCRLLGHDRTSSLSQSRRWDLARAQFIIKHWRCAW